MPSRLESSGPIERSLCDEHVEELYGCQSYRGVVPAPPGVVMVAPSKDPRNAQQGKVKAAPDTMGRNQRGQEQYRGRSPNAPSEILEELRQIGHQEQHNQDHGS